MRILAHLPYHVQEKRRSDRDRGRRGACWPAPRGLARACRYHRPDPHVRPRTQLNVATSAAIITYEAIRQRLLASDERYRGTPLFVYDREQSGVS